MAMFPTGVIPFYSTLSGREATTTVPGARMGATAAAQLAGMRRGSAPTHMLKSNGKNAEVRRRASFGGGGTMSKSTAMSWQKYYKPEVSDEEDAESSEDDDEVDDEDASSAYHPAMDSYESSLDDVDEQKITHINFDPRLFRFLLNYFRDVVSKNEEMHRTASDLAKMNGNATAEVTNGVPIEEDPLAAMEEGRGLGDVDEESMEEVAESGEKHDGDSEKPAGSETLEVGEDAAAAKANNPRSSTTSLKKTSETPFLRRLSSFKISVVSFFTGSNAQQPDFGPIETPSLPISKPAPSLRPIQSIIVLREEIECYVIHLAQSEPSAVGGWGSMFKWKGRRSNPKIPRQGSSTVELDDFSTKTASLLQHVKVYCGERLLEQKLVKKPYAEMAYDIFNATELAAMAASNAGANDEDGDSIKNAYTGIATGTGAGCRPPKAPREKVVCELDDQLMHSQLMAALETFSDFSSETAWNYREVEPGKAHVSSVAMLTMRDIGEIQAKIDEESKAPPAAAPTGVSNGVGPNTGRRGSAAPSKGSGDSGPAGLITQVEETESAAVSMHHLNQHLLMKRPVRKCWWEVMPLRVEGQYLERRISLHRAESVASRKSNGAVAGSEGDGAGVGGPSGCGAEASTSRVSTSQDEIAPNPLPTDDAPSSQPSKASSISQIASASTTSVSSTAPVPSSDKPSSDKRASSSGPSAGRKWSKSEPKPPPIDVKLWLRRTWTIEFCSV
ncbi:hypothetical protein HK104_003479 [Borealophlyctis nickersoniae]|nr:hypothetical protein HK104_003479 [Borealophlyctis nickersoniae]